MCDNAHIHERVYEILVCGGRKQSLKTNELSGAPHLQRIAGTCRPHACHANFHALAALPGSYTCMLPMHTFISVLLQALVLQLSLQPDSCYFPVRVDWRIGFVNAANIKCAVTARLLRYSESARRNFTGLGAPCAVQSRYWSHHALPTHCTPVQSCLIPARITTVQSLSR